jgi:hypothetical protein
LIGRELAETIHGESLRAASRMLVDGFSDQDAAESIATRFPGVDVRKLLELAGDRLSQAARCDRQVVIGFAFEAYREIYRLSKEAGEYADATRAVKELVALARATEDDVPNDDKDEAQ